METADPTVSIEHIEPGYTRYRSIDGRRWEVRGFCDKRGYCLIGANIPTLFGPVQIESLEHLNMLKALLGRERLDSELDVPVTPDFTGCCPLVGKWV